MGESMDEDMYEGVGVAGEDQIVSSNEWRNGAIVSGRLLDEVISRIEYIAECFRAEDEDNLDGMILDYLWEKDIERGEIVNALDGIINMDADEISYSSLDEFEADLISIILDEISIDGEFYSGVLE